MGTLVYFGFPAHGHLNPTLSVIRELTRRGGDVLYYCTEPFRCLIEQTGAEFRCYAARFPNPGEGPGPFARLTSTLEAQLEATCAILEGHLDEIREAAPDVIIHDSFAPWGGLAAQLLGVPTIATIPSILIDREIDARYGLGRAEDPALTQEWCARFQSHCREKLDRYRLPCPLTPPQLLQSYGDSNIVFTSRAFQPLAERFDRDRFKFVGPCLERRPDAPEFPFGWLDATRPLVLVSLGTVYGNLPRFYRTCLDEFAGSPWQIVVSTGGGFPLEDLGVIPENCLVRASVPQIEILKRCSAFVTHGGANSTHEALVHGVPLVLVPQGADQFWISARAAELGCGLVLDSKNMAPGAIRKSVAEVLLVPRYAIASQRAGVSLRAAGGPGAAANVIETFRRRRSGSIGEPAPVSRSASPDPRAPCER